MIIDKVKNTINKFSLLSTNDKVVVGVSGGPDSVALLYLLNTLKKEFRCTLHIAHLDHMLRKDSSKDAEFVKKLAQKLKIAATFAKINVKELAKKGSLEEVARNARLNFFFKVARRIKAKKIALGHTQDDQSETVLMRILRGTGLYGLSAILPKRDIAGFKIIRPLIGVRRKEIEAFLKRRNIKSLIDKTNLEDVYFRNRIRHKLLPLLEKNYNRNITKILSNMAEVVAYDYDYLSRQATVALKRLGSRINLKKFLRLHPAIQRLLLRMAVAKIKGDMRRITFQHIREIEELVINRPVNSIVDLPQGVSVIKKKKSLLFYRRAKF